LLSRIAHPWRIRAIIDARTPIETARDAHRMPHPAEPPRQRVVIAHRASSSRPAPDLGDEHSLVNLGQPSQKKREPVVFRRDNSSAQSSPGAVARAKRGAPIASVHTISLRAGFVGVRGARGPVPLSARRRRTPRIDPRARPLARSRQASVQTPSKEMPTGRWVRAGPRSESCTRKAVWTRRHRAA
jgi:hypothetical protein